MNAMWVECAFINDSNAAYQIDGLRTLEVQCKALDTP